MIHEDVIWPAFFNNNIFGDDIQLEANSSTQSASGNINIVYRGQLTTSDNIPETGEEPTVIVEMLTSDITLTYIVKEDGSVTLLLKGKRIKTKNN